MFIGKTALVTGSTSGIGLGIVRTLAAQGANVILNGFGDAREIERLRVAEGGDGGGGRGVAGGGGVQVCGAVAWSRRSAARRVSARVGTLVAARRSPQTRRASLGHTA